MESCFIYWDHSNIFIEAQRLAEERQESPGARYRVRIQFDRLLALAHAGRPVTRAAIPALRFFSAATGRVI